VGYKPPKISVDICKYLRDFKKFTIHLTPLNQINHGLTANPESFAQHQLEDEISSKRCYEENNLSVSGGIENSAPYLSLGYLIIGVVDKTH
jgi:hypothetical protein